MSPHGIAEPHNQNASNSGKKCPLARPLIMQNFVAIRQEVSKISAIENLCFQKKWARIHQSKSLKTYYPLKPPHHAKFHWDRWKPTWRNNFLHLSIFWLPGLSGGVHQLPLATCKISSRSDDPSPIYLLPNFVDFIISGLFVAGMTHKTTKKLQTICLRTQL